MMTNQLGAVTNRKDYSAFGEETISAQPQSSLGYTAPGTELRKGYTGYEKDAESGLDFAQARYYNSTHGRYTSIDPLTASASIRNPQTFNRYSYVLNSPYKFTDPLGLLPMRDYDTCTCEAQNESCSDEWGPTTWDAEEEVPEEEETEEGVAENQETEGGDQQRAEEASPPPAPSAEQNAEQTQQSEAGPFVVPKETLDKYGSENETDTNYQPQPQFGNGSCSVLPQMMLPNLGRVTNWTQGTDLYDENGDPNSNIARGTVIATFNDDGRYGPPGTKKHNENKDNHAAVFLSFGTYEISGAQQKGIWVIDQWQNRTHEGQKISGIRFIALKDGITDPSNNARTFSVVMVKRPRR